MDEQAVPMTRCETCGNEVPDGTFCGICGAPLHPQAHGSPQRWHTFAAMPNEHLLHLSPVSTLFPHLPHRHTAPFRVAALVITVALIVLGYLRWTAPSVALAALGVPVLYLLYLYEVEIYDEDPVFLIAVTVVLGGILGALFGKFTGSYVTRAALLAASPAGLPANRLLIAAVVLPLAAQALMLAGALIAFIRWRDREALDGFTFAAAGALGFIFASTLVELLPELRSGMVSVAPATQNALRIVERGLLIPFIAASTSGIIGASLWLWRRPSRALPRFNWTTNLGVSLLIAAVVQVGLGFVSVLVQSQVRATIIYFVVALLLLLWVRIVLHFCLLSEAGEITPGPIVPCPHCHHMVPRLPFCPHCGLAMSATPKVGEHRAAVRTWGKT